MKKIRILVSILIAILTVNLSSSVLLTKSNAPIVAKGYKLFEEWGSLTNLSDYDEIGYDDLATSYIEMYK